MSHYDYLKSALTDWFKSLTWLHTLYNYITRSYYSNFAETEYSVPETIIQLWLNGITSGQKKGHLVVF